MSTTSRQKCLLVRIYSRWQTVSEVTEAALKPDCRIDVLVMQLTSGGKPRKQPIRGNQHCPTSSKYRSCWLT